MFDAVNTRDIAVRIVDITHMAFIEIRQFFTIVINLYRLYSLVRFHNLYPIGKFILNENLRRF